MLSSSEQSQISKKRKIALLTLSKKAVEFSALWYTTEARNYWLLGKSELKVGALSDPAFLQTLTRPCPALYEGFCPGSSIPFRKSQTLPSTRLIRDSVPTCFWSIGPRSLFPFRLPLVNWQVPRKHIQHIDIQKATDSNTSHGCARCKNVGIDARQFLSWLAKYSDISHEQISVSIWSKAFNGLKFERTH